MQSSTRQTISSSSQQSSTFVIRTNGQPSISQSFLKEYEPESQNSLMRERQELLMKVLMMGFEIERKDVVVKNLIRDIEALETRNSLSSSEQVYSLRQQLTRTRRHAQQLQHKVSQLQLINNQISMSKTTACQQLQEQVRSLQHRNKQLQIKKIQVQSLFQKLQTQNKMMNYKMVNFESTQKGKSREMQNMIMDLQKRVQEEKKISNQLKIIIQTAHEQVRMLKDNQIRLCHQFDEKLGSMQRELSLKEDLKRSHATISQQKIQTTQNELLRMQEEVKFLRKKLDQQQNIHEKKEGQIVAELRRTKEIEAEFYKVKHMNELMRGDLQQKTNQVNGLVRELNDARSAYNALEQSRELSSLETTNTFTHQITLLQQESETYRQRIALLQQELDKSRSQMRKLKRKSQNNINSECASCKILQSATSIKSHKNVNDLNLAEIIQQTQRLHDSSLKIQQILSSKKFPISVGDYDSRMSIDNSFVE